LDAAVSGAPQPMLHDMKIVPRRERCALCDDEFIAGHGVCVGGRVDYVVCCADCYVIFSDLRTALRVAGSAMQAEKPTARQVRRGE